MQESAYTVNAICVNQAGDLVFTKGASVCQISAGEVTTLAGVCDDAGHTDVLARTRGSPANCTASRRAARTVPSLFPTEGTTAFAE